MSKPTVLCDADTQPCPWCGTQPTVYLWTAGGSSRCDVVCDGPDCPVKPDISDVTLRHALARWNQRAPTAKEAP